MSGATREWARGVLDAIFDFGRVTGSSRGAANRTVSVDLEGNLDQEERAETSTEDLWGSAAVQYRPADPDADGAAEALYVRRGNEMLPIATRDFRFQVDLEKGEVVVTNFSKEKPARVFLRADGTLVIEADEVRIGDAGASNTIALGDRVKSHLDDLKTWLDGHVHGYSWTGTAGVQLTSPPTVQATPPWLPLDTSPTVPDVESRHLVED